MSYSKGKTRPLGLIRHTAAFNDVIPRLPPLKTVSDPKLESDYQLQGSAISVSTSKENTETENGEVSGRQSKGRPKSDSASSNEAKSDDVEKTQAMTREKNLKVKIMSLQKVIDDLKAQLVEKERTIVDLHEQFQRQEINYKELLEKERKAHEVTRQDLSSTQSELSQKQQHIENLTVRHEQQIKELRLEMDRRMEEQRQEREREIAIRDEKLNKLKKQMAEALKGNSWERQQQLDELTKELGRLQEEADLLRIKLKQKSKGGGCTNCDGLSTKLQQHQAALKERDALLKDLKAVCSNYEQQLSRQELMLKQFAEQNKVPVFNGK